MEIDEEPARAAASSPRETSQNGLDSDDETLRFDKDDDLYSSDLDEADALWVRKQHRPAAECSGDGIPADGTRSGEDSGDDDDDDDGDDTVGASPPPEAAPNSTGAAGGDTPQQGQGRAKAKARGGGKAVGVASDAQLSCPLCFTTVCLECQRHALYHNQYRAVTGINITIDDNESLTLDQVSGRGGGGGDAKRPTEHGGARGRRHGGTHRATQQQAGLGGGGGEEEEEERFRPVCCGECDHRVGVLDDEEVFHFFNIIASG